MSNLLFFEKVSITEQKSVWISAGRSTSDVLLEFLDNAYDMLNDSGLLLAIYLNFSKAFDTVDHNILLMRGREGKGYWMGENDKRNKNIVR